MIRAIIIAKKQSIIRFNFRNINLKVGYFQKVLIYLKLKNSNQDLIIKGMELKRRNVKFSEDRISLVRG